MYTGTPVHSVQTDRERVIRPYPAALAQCLLALHDAGAARAPAVASLAASLTFELASIARGAGEAGAAAYCSSLSLPALRQEDESAEKPEGRAWHISLTTFGHVSSHLISPLILSPHLLNKIASYAVACNMCITLLEGAAAPLAAPGVELVALEEYLLGLPEWKDLNSEARPCSGCPPRPRHAL